MAGSYEQPQLPFETGRPKEPEGAEGFTNVRTVAVERGLDPDDGEAVAGLLKELMGSGDEVVKLKYAKRQVGEDG